MLALGLTFALLDARVVMAQSAKPEADKPDELAVFLQEKNLVDKLSNEALSAGREMKEKASELVVAAMAFLGLPYRMGGNTFEQGLDCSGFTRLLVKQTLGLVLPRRSVEQAAATQSIKASDIQPGDLVFFNTRRASYSHVGLYVGDNKFIHSPRSGASIRMDDMTTSYWRKNFDGARRVAQSTAQLKTASDAQP